jgi:hypothetical protein
MEKKTPALAFRPAADPGFYFRQRLESLIDEDVIVFYDEKKKCLVTKPLSPKPTTTKRRS